MEKERPSQKLLAYHEAGHAVFAYGMCHPIKHVRIGDEPECVSRVAWIRSRWGIHEAIREAITGLLIGRYAEHRAATGTPMEHVPFEEFYAPVDEFWRTASVPESLPADDAEILFRFLLPLKREKAKRLYDQACYYAVVGTETRWPEIEAVAERLWDVGYLEGAEVTRLIEATRSKQVG